MRIDSAPSSVSETRTKSQKPITDTNVEFGSIIRAVSHSFLIVVAILSIVIGLIHSHYPGQFDDQTAKFFGLAVLSLVIHQVTKFKGFGIEFEKRVEELEDAIVGLEKEVGPGSKAASQQAVVAENVQQTSAAPNTTGAADPEDPNKGQFGGKCEANGRKLTATIRPAAGPKSSRCRVTIRVLSTDPNRPLLGDVVLHLHPTFGRWSSYPLQAKDGVAEDTIVSYGAFTIGAETDNGKTRLELDLMNVRGGTDRFYEE